LLGEHDNGRWFIAPKDEPIETSRRYRSGTLVLETEFRTKTGSVSLVDFMPPGDRADLVRILVGRQGRVEFRAEFVVRFNYGATVPWVNPLNDGSISAVAGPERLVLRTAAILRGED
jgi:GH15 family glucan-1,4-alpha-glucosidase